MSETPDTTDTAEDPIDLDAAILENAVAPASASVDRESATQHSLKDQIMVAQYLDRKKNDPGRGKGRTIRMSKTVPPRFA